MKYFLVISILFLSSGLLTAPTIYPNYDGDLADSLGSDDYGMKPYVLVILKSGSNQTDDNVQKSFRGHLDNITRLVDLGKLVVAGPLGKNENDYRGIFFLDVPDLEAARELLETDPAIKEKLLEPELYSWYGSAALPAYLEVSEKIWKVQP